MLMVCPDAFFQSKPPLTADAPFGALALPPTPQALSTGRLAAAAPATPNAANMFRRDICGPPRLAPNMPELRSRLMCLVLRWGLD
jgi:hypothetical protein